MSGGALRIGLLVIAGLLWAAPAWGQDAIGDLLGRPIAGVELRVEKKLETAAPLLALVDIKAGDRFSLEASRRVTDRLNQLLRFETVVVGADVRADGSLLLTFDLTPRHPVDRLVFTFTGPTAISASELERLVRDQFNGLPAFNRRSEVAAAVRSILKNEGYWSADAEPVLEETHDPDRATMHVTVQSGPRTRITSLTVKGVPLSDPALRPLAGRGIATGAPYRERELITALAEIREDLRSKRYYRAIARAETPTFTPDGTGVALVVVIERGPLVVLKVNGELPGSEDEFIPIKRQRSVDIDLLENAQFAIMEGHQQRGYWHARASFTRDESVAGQLVITFTIVKGKRYRVAGIDLPPGLHLALSDFQAFDALKTGAWFDEHGPRGVERSLIAIRGLYQLRGFHRVTLSPKYEERDGPSPQEGGVVIRPSIVEGPKAIVKAITFDLGDRPKVTEAELRARLQAQEGAVFVLAHPELDREGLRAYYESRGFLDRVTSITVTLNEDGTEATLAVFAREGPQVLVGEIIVVGNVNMTRERILREIPLTTGAAFSQAALTASYRALKTLSSLGNVRISPEERLPGETTVRIVISVEESSSRTFEVGGGVEAGTRARVAADGTSEDRLEIAPRASIGVGRQNLNGKNRAVNAFARVSFKRKSGVDDPAAPVRGLGFIEYRLTGSFTERYAFRSETDIVFSVTSEQAVRTSFNFVRQVGSADVSRSLTPRVTLLGRYSLESTRLFDEAIDESDQPVIDRLFPQVRLSVFSAGAVWERRNDPLKPSKGSQVNASFDIALRPLGSEVGFAKSFVEASVYRRIPSPKLLVLALRGQLGIARGFGRTVPVLDASGAAVLDLAGNPVLEVITDLPASRRFFAGGASSVRGFQIDRLGVREILNDAGLSNGGNALVVFNAELRALVGKLFNRDLTVVGFVDAGNAFHRASELDLSRLRATVGFGFRYESPFGPLRLDFGFKTDRLVFPNARERRWEFHLSIGEVF